MLRPILLALLLTAPIALAQTASIKNSPEPLTPSKSSGSAKTLELTPSKNSDTTPRRLKIDLSIANPQDLKVREGDRVSKGQVIADRDSDRSRLNRERRETLLTIAKIEQTPPPALKITPPVRELPAASFAIEEAAIQAAEMKFNQAGRNYNSSLTNDPFITARANLDFTKAGVEQAYREVENQQKKLEVIASIKSIPPEMLTHETERLKRARSNWEQKQAEYEFRAAEYKQVEQGRRESIESLKAAIDTARVELEIAQARLRAAKEARNKAEYDHQIATAKRDEEKNQSAIAVSQQNLVFCQSLVDG
jgi:hypothetical protein